MGQAEDGRNVILSEAADQKEGANGLNRDASSLSSARFGLAAACSGSSGVPCSAMRSLVVRRSR